MDAKQRFLRKKHICSRCGINLGGKTHPWCKGCQAAYYQARCAADPDHRKKLAEKSRQWRAENRELCLKVVRSNNLKRQFGITIEQWEAMYEKQNGLCAICEQPETATHRNGKLQRLAVDHCHKSMRNRGLLCAKCNHALERIENIPEWGTKALAYLAKLEKCESTSDVKASSQQSSISNT